MELCTAQNTRQMILYSTRSNLFTSDSFAIAYRARCEYEYVLHIFARYGPTGTDTELDLESKYDEFIECASSNVQPHYHNDY